MAQISYINKSAVTEAKRFDAEYFKPYCLSIQNIIDDSLNKSIQDLNCGLDCSAFYPSITNDYDFNKVGIPFLRVNEIQDGIVKITNNTAFLPQSILDEYSSNIKLAFPGDLIIAKGGNSLAKVGLLTNEYSKYSVCRDLIIVRTQNIEDVSNYFLWLFLHSDIGKNMMLRTASQTGQPHLTIKSIKDLTIPIKMFNDIDFEQIYKKSVEKENEAKKLYKNAEQILLKELGLLDFKPKHKLTFETSKSKIEEAERFDTEYFQPKYEEIIEKIENYSEGFVNLGNHSFAELQRGSLISDKFYTKEKGVGYIRGADFSSGILNKKKLTYISENFVTNTETQVSKNDIVFSLIGSVGASALVSVSFNSYFISNNTGKISLKTDFSSITLQIFLQSVAGQLQFEKEKMQTAQPKISTKEISRFKIPLINPEIQNIIAEKIIESHKLRKESKQLLEDAKIMVEDEIEKMAKS